MDAMRRTATCGDLTGENEGQTVILNGWVDAVRNHGSIVFIDLRDRYGITQCVADTTSPSTLSSRVLSLKKEACIAVRGQVRKRPEAMRNLTIPTGEIELSLSDLHVLSETKGLPFEISDAEKGAQESLRLRYRYLDLRRQPMQERLILRHRVLSAIRSYLRDEAFLELETPTLIRSTPEGARDFLVPSRRHPGRCFALPQSPQLYKQIFMIAGFDKYFQIARCYRDEDLRGDRQPEFSQIDIEMSFVSRDDVLSLSEGLMRKAFLKGLSLALPQEPFPKISYRTAIETYGSDKPDLRFGMPLVDFSPYARESSFTIFLDVLAKRDGVVKGLIVKGVASRYSRREIEEWGALAKPHGLKGLAWMKVGSSGFEGGISRFFADKFPLIRDRLSLQEGDLLLLAAARWVPAHLSLGVLRNHLGEILGLIPKNRFAFAWVVDFPLFEWDEEEARWSPSHHLFSMPHEEHIPFLEEDPSRVIGQVYDLVLNGNELGSGSIRIHDRALQERIFRTVNISEEEADARFGFFLEALQYGAPPHGGIAFGMDRLLAIMAGVRSIREVIAFPKGTAVASPMDGSPTAVKQTQLEELGLQILPTLQDHS